VVSKSVAPFILNLYSKWDLQKVSAKRAINSKGDRRGQVEEIIAFGKIETLS
jgi:DNA adenine methylase